MIRKAKNPDQLPVSGFKVRNTSWGSYKLPPPGLNNVSKKFRFVCRRNCFETTLSPPCSIDQSAPRYDIASTHGNAHVVGLDVGKWGALRITMVLSVLL